MSGGIELNWMFGLWVGHGWLSVPVRLFGPGVCDGIRVHKIQNSHAARSRSHLTPHLGAVSTSSSLLKPLFWQLQSANKQSRYPMIITGNPASCAFVRLASHTSEDLYFLLPGCFFGGDPRSEATVVGTTTCCAAPIRFSRTKICWRFLNS